MVFNFLCFFWLPRQLPFWPGRSGSGKIIHGSTAFDLLYLLNKSLICLVNIEIVGTEIYRSVLLISMCLVRASAFLTALRWGFAFVLHCLIFFSLLLGFGFNPSLTFPHASTFGSSSSRAFILHHGWNASCPPRRSLFLKQERSIDALMLKQYYSFWIKINCITLKSHYPLRPSSFF